jgi:hypothetical protein
VSQAPKIREAQIKIYDAYTGRHLAIIRRRKEVKNCHIIPTRGLIHHIKDKLERVKKGTRLLTTE